MDKNLKNAQWVCKYLGVSRKCVYDMVKRGELPSVRIGWKIFFDQEVLEKFMQDGMKKSLKKVNDAGAEIIARRE